MTRVLRTSGQSCLRQAGFFEGKAQNQHFGVDHFQVLAHHVLDDFGGYLEFSDCWFYTSISEAQWGRVQDSGFEVQRLTKANY